jgi:hypothetical protein
MRSVLVLLVLEVGICTSFLADHWPPLQRRENSLAHSFLATTRDDREFVFDASPAHKRARLARPLVAGSPGSYLRIDIGEDPERVFEENPPSATDWAVILNNARKVGLSTAAIDHPLTWEDAGEIPLLALDHELSTFDHSVLCVDLRRDADTRAEALPSYLARHAVPLANLTGPPGNLPRVNRTVLPSSANGDANTIFAFRLLENEIRPGDSQLPAPPPRAFARWDDVLIPSFPVALAMAQHEVAPKDVHIELGHQIRLGNGPIIPIDDFGQMLLPPGEQNQTSFTTAESLIERGFSARLIESGAPDCALLLDASNSSPSPWRTPTQLMQTVRSLDLLKRPGPVEIHPQLPLWAETVLFLMIGILSAVFLRFSSFNRSISFALVVLGCFMVLIGLLDLTTNHTWTPLTPILACALGGWLFCSRMVRHLPTEPSLPER